MKTIWMRAGVHLLMNDGEDEAILGTDREKANKALEKVLLERRFCIEGECYIPQNCVEEYNSQNGTEYPAEDADFEMKTIHMDRPLAKSPDIIESAMKCLIDNGIAPDEAETVLQALCYILCDEEVFP